MDNGWRPRGDLRYPDYLKLDRLLALQEPRSRPAHHDEMLFIVVHQVFELWFKLQLHGFDEMARALRADDVHGSLKIARRAIEIQRSLTQQIDVLETMSALDFLEFRADLEGASGFQSAQYREVEAVVGIRPEQRVPVTIEGSSGGWEKYTAFLLPEEVERIAARMRAPSLEEGYLDLVCRLAPPALAGHVYLADLQDALWDGDPKVARGALEVLEPAAFVADSREAAVLAARLERLPLLAGLAGDVRARLRSALGRGRLLEALAAEPGAAASPEERSEIRLIEEEAARRLQVPLGALEHALAGAGAEPAEVERVRAAALRAASLREVYRRDAHARGTTFELFLLGEALVELAEVFQLFRFRHVKMVERMIGKRRGTGGSPGVAYLEQTLRYRVFPQLMRVRTHL